MRFGRFQYIVLILGEKGVSGIVKRLLDVVFLGGLGIVCLALVHEIRKIFKTLNRRNPFMMDNVNFRIYTGSTHWGCF
jgi:hypothetical protein